MSCTLAFWMSRNRNPGRNSRIGRTRRRRDRRRFEITVQDRLVWAVVEKQGGGLRRTDDAEGADLALQVVERRFMSHLVVIPLRTSLLVNGLPALGFSALLPRDSLLVSPGAMFQVTERVQPYGGPPQLEMLGQKCPCCQLPIEAETVCVTCKCGAIYHDESEQSHPDLTADDRLNCFSKLKNCLACKRELTRQPYLVWDPAEVL
jgi:hypothetical protein